MKKKFLTEDQVFTFTNFLRHRNRKVQKDEERGWRTWDLELKTAGFPR